MKLIIATLLLAASQAFASSSTSTCVPTVTVTTIPVPSSVQSGLSSACVSYPSIYSIGSIVSTIELSSPSFDTVETEIDYYEQSYSTLISYMETIYASPWLDTNPSEFSEETVAFTTLASDISYLVSVESSHASLASVQSSLQYVMQTDSSILTDLYVYTEVAYPSVYSASSILDSAELTSPSIFGEVVAVSSAVSAYYTVSYAMSALSYSIYSVPYSVYSDVETIISSSSTVSSTVVSYLESCYPTLYSYLTVITAFTYESPSVVSDITGYISVAYSVSSVGSAVSTIISYEMPTLSYEISAVSTAVSTWSSFVTGVEWLSDVTATSSTISYAETTIEGSFYASPSVAYDIYTALLSPSTVTDPSQISSEEASHLSLVSAFDDIISWESDYTSYASTLESIESYLTTIFASDRTILTAASYVSAVTSASTVTATYSLVSAETVVSSITTALSYITYVTALSPSVSCEESEIESYALTYSTVVTEIWSAVVSPSTVVSPSYYAQLEDSFSTLFYAITSIWSEVSYYPSLSTYEYDLIVAASTDSSLLTQWSTFTYQSSSVSSSITYISC